MPRAMGASIGVKESVTGLPAAADSDCSISGVCWWPPPTLYADIEPMTAAECSVSASPRPAPEVPLAATTTMSSTRTSPAPSNGASASATAVG